MDLIPLGASQTLASQASNYVAAFNLDYNSSGVYEVTRIGEVVTIKSTNPNITFSNGVSNNVSFTIANFTGTAFEITDIIFEESVNPCTHVRLRATTSELATNVLGPEVIANNTSNPFYIEVLRSGGILTQGILLSCSNAAGTIATAKVELPNTLALDNLGLTVNPSPNGGTVIGFVSNTTGLTLQYSLDNTTWQASSIFNSLIAGDYIFYVKDQLGCSIQKSFTVSEFSSGEEHFYISPSNSIRFAKTSVAGVTTDSKIDANRLSSSDDAKHPYKTYQVFKNTDTITTQFESSFATIAAKVIDENGIETALTIDKKTTNIGLTDSRDATYYNFGEGKTGIYFTTGKTYDYGTGIDADDDYTLNGSLPEWGVVGNFIKLNNAWFEIEDVYYDEEKYAEILVIENLYTGVEAVTIVSSVYDRENYDVYEFSTVMNSHNNREVEIIITNEDSNFDNLVHTSEILTITDELDGFKELIYSNDTNTDMLYATGIAHKIWIRTERVVYKPLGEMENFKTDTKVILLNGNVRKAKEFTFELLTSEIMIKLYLALHHRELYIDGERYVLNESPEVGDAEEDTNLYEVKATLIKANESYDSKSSNVGIPITGAAFEVPSLLEVVSGGFLRI